MNPEQLLEFFQRHLPPAAVTAVLMALLFYPFYKAERDEWQEESNLRVSHVESISETRLEDYRTALERNDGLREELEKLKRDKKAVEKQLREELEKLQEQKRVVQEKLRANEDVLLAMVKIESGPVVKFYSSEPGNEN